VTRKLERRLRGRGAQALELGLDIGGGEGVRREAPAEPRRHPEAYPLTLGPPAPGQHRRSEGASFFGIGRNRPWKSPPARIPSLDRQAQKRYGLPAVRLGGG